jgi:hypothetical protein
MARIDLFEARAILLGRLGRHDSALELYVYRLHDYDRAERYGVHDWFTKQPLTSQPIDIASKYTSQTPKRATYS